MVSPQVENGFITIASGSKENDIFSAIIRSEMSGVETAVILTVMRKTWGFKKKTDRISISQFVEMTGRKRRNVIYAINTLVQNNALVRIKHGTDVSEYAINKDFSCWLVHGVALGDILQLVQKSAPASAKNGIQLVQPIAPTKDIITKDILQKKGTVKINRGFQSMREIFNETRKPKLS